MRNYGIAQHGPGAKKAGSVANGARSESGASEEAGAGAQRSDYRLNVTTGLMEPVIITGPVPLDGTKDSEPMGKSRFEVQSMAGNIIPAVSTTNGIVAAVQV